MTSWIRSAACASSLALAISCGSNAGGGVAPGGSGGTHSSSMVLAPDGTTLYVVNPEADSVSVLDVAGRTLSARSSWPTRYPRQIRRARSLRP